MTIGFASLIQLDLLFAGAKKQACSGVTPHRCKTGVGDPPGRHSQWNGNNTGIYAAEECLYKSKTGGMYQNDAVSRIDASLQMSRNRPGPPIERTIGERCKLLVLPGEPQKRNSHRFRYFIGLPLKHVSQGQNIHNAFNPSPQRNTLRTESSIIGTRASSSK